MHKRLGSTYDGSSARYKSVFADWQRKRKSAKERKKEFVLRRQAHTKSESEEGK